MSLPLPDPAGPRLLAVPDASDLPQLRLPASTDLRSMEALCLGESSSFAPLEMTKRDALENTNQQNVL